MNQTLLEIRNKRAVLVGVNGYNDNSIRSLAYSVADVTSTQELLVDPKRAGYDLANLKLIFDNAEEASMRPVRSSIMSSVKSLAETAGEEDSILFFFSGHGIEKDAKSYLLPSDARLNVLEETAISIDWIKQIMVTSNARVKIVILDACHAGALIGKAESGRMSKAFHESIFPAPEGFAILSSCKMNEVSYEDPEKKHGVFSYYLNEGFSGFADFDSDGIITISDISRYVSEKVKNWSFEKGVQQNPTLECKISGDIPLITALETLRVAPQPQPSEERDLREYVDKIHLLKNWGDYSSDAWAHEICARLLRFFTPEQIAKKDNTYLFPSGYIGRSARLGSQYYRANELCFEYQSSNWDLIEAIISDIQHLGWDGIIYELNVQLNKSELGKLCKEAKMNVVSFSPEENFEMMVKAEGWGQEGYPATITFTNLEKTALIEIEQPVAQEKTDLESNFFEKLNPKNILTFLKPSLSKPSQKTN